VAAGPGDSLPRPGAPLADFRLLGAKGATGSQDSFLKLFGGDADKVRELDRRVCHKLGFEGSLPISGQTYTRLIDSRILDVLKNIALAAHKFAVDFRLLQHLKMVDEPFESKQVGSSKPWPTSATPCAASGCAPGPLRHEPPRPPTRPRPPVAGTHPDDSAGRRLYLPQAFLALDAALILYANVVRGAVVYPRVARRLLDEELPFLATETILMQAVLRGGDRQNLHEAIREHALEVVREMKEEAADNHLLEKLAADGRFFRLDELRKSPMVRTSPDCPLPRSRSTSGEVEPLLARYAHLGGPEPR
jgi:adenylosuccinate lyase